jgi:hypothetical protein
MGTDVHRGTHRDAHIHTYTHIIHIHTHTHPLAPLCGEVTLDFSTLRRAGDLMSEAHAEDPSDCMPAWE